MSNSFEKKAKLFKAFCDEKRLRIIDLLKNGELCVCVLTEKMNMPQSSLSHHMKILCDAGIVTGRDEWKWTYYSLNKEMFLYASELLKGMIEGTEFSDSITACANDN